LIVNQNLLIVHRMVEQDVGRSRFIYKNVRVGRFIAIGYTIIKHGFIDISNGASVVDQEVFSNQGRDMFYVIDQLRGIIALL